MCDVMEEIEREIMEKASKETAEAVKQVRREFGSIIVIDNRKMGMTSGQIREKLVHCYEFSSEEADMLIKRFF